MTPSFIFRCRVCQARIKAPVRLLGQSRTCPGCGHRFIVQLQAPPEAGPLLVADDSRAISRQSHRSYY
jgi:hypothetical protein